MKDEMRQSSKEESENLIRALASIYVDRTSGIARAAKSPKVNPFAIITRFSDIQPQPIEWLWPGRFALGKTSLIVGDPGLGKSLLTSAIAAAVSKGSPWPVDGASAPAGDVILLSAEDDASDTIRPRLDAAGADARRIRLLECICERDAKGNAVERTPSLAKDIALIEAELSLLPECRVLIIDPISAYLGDTDSHKNADIRGLLAPLGKMAARRKIAVIAISHLNKSTGGSAMYRTMGSLAFTAAARASYVVIKDSDNLERRLLLPVKNNLTKESTGLAYTIVENDGQPVIAWEQQPVAKTADEALIQWGSRGSEAGEDYGVSMLRSLLGDGPVAAAAAMKEARQAGLTDKQIRRAREKLGIEARKVGFAGGWEWALPEDAQRAEGAQSKMEGILGEEGHLRGEKWQVPPVDNRPS